MDLISKLQQIILIQNDNSDEKTGSFNNPISTKHITQIEKLLGESLSDEFIKLYSFANGQSESGKGILLGERFISSEEIITQLEFSLTLVKPENKIIKNIVQSDKLLKEIVDFYVDKAPKHKLYGIKKSWYKIEFKCGVGSYQGPYIYLNENTTSKEREVLEVNFESYKIIARIINELHELEKETYNWDELEFVVFSNGKYDVERTFFDFDNQITFTSIPENFIKKKYFHCKWLPLFSDYGGNYIGIDFDPDIKGKKGQIINFGRDEEEMIVLGDSLEQFFDFILIEIKKKDNNLLNLKNHLHDELKKLKK